MVEFKVGKRYALDCGKAVETFDYFQWTQSTKKLIEVFKEKPRKCLYMTKFIPSGEHSFLYALEFEGMGTVYGYTKELASLFREADVYVQEEMEL